MPKNQLPWKADEVKKQFSSSYHVGCFFYEAPETYMLSLSICFVPSIRTLLLDPNVVQ